MKKIAYYSGCYHNHWDPDAGKAVIHILEVNRHQVVVPLQQCCGMPKLSYGAVGGAMKTAVKVVDRLSELIEDGCEKIVTACPSCSYAIKEYYPFLLKGEKASAVAQKTSFLSTYLLTLLESGELSREFGSVPMSIAYHAPCHLRAQHAGDSSTSLLRLIPGLNIVNLDRGCCGMSGTAGYKRTYYDHSVAISRPLTERIAELGNPTVVTDCGMCGLQIRDLCNVEVMHPAVLISRAYERGGRANWTAKSSS